MGSEIVKHESSGAGLAPGEWQAMREQAKALVLSKFLPKAVDTPEKAIAVMMTGRELGIGPMQALRCVHIIDGKPTLAAELIAVLRRVPGAVFEVAASTNDHCTVLAARPGRPEREFTFTMDDAKAAGLTSKDNWKKYPRAMLRSRAITEAARAVFPDSTLGVYDPDELGAVTNDAGEIVAMPPERLPRITTHAEPDEDPDATGDAALQAMYMANLEDIEKLIGDATTWDAVCAARKLLGGRNLKSLIGDDFRRDRFARKLGPADEREFTKAWQRMNRQLCKKEEALDPGSAAEIIGKVNMETGEVTR
jgi:CBS-domain-containing membrane protein